MQRSRPDLTENKLLMLYTLVNVGPMTNLQAQRFFLENEFMDYIDIQLSLAELADNGLLRTAHEPAGMTYSVTDFGAEALDMFKAKVPYSRRNAVDLVTESWKETLRHEASVFADYAVTPQGDFAARLAVREKGRLLFEMTIALPDRESAKKVCDSWHKKSSDVYMQALNILMSDDE
ncbi:MAG: DUF4364 family protein [Clostridiales bacterium]|nr:DUF4364 family protein [Clostridiales bacterium]MBQ2816582.1 DUF4364 family protein [Clostridia bacterium]